MAQLSNAQKTLLKAKGMFAFFKHQRRDILLITTDVAFMKYEKFETHFEQREAQEKGVYIVINDEVNIAFGKAAEGKKPSNTKHWQNLGPYGLRRDVHGDGRTAYGQSLRQYRGHDGA